jgi:hypothetical protein
MGKNSRFFMEMKIAEQAELESLERGITEKAKLVAEQENFVEQEELDSYHWSLGQCVS